MTLRLRRKAETSEEEHQCRCRCSKVVWLSRSCCVQHVPEPFFGWFWSQPRKRCLPTHTQISRQTRNQPSCVHPHQLVAQVATQTFSTFTCYNNSRVWSSSLLTLCNMMPMFLHLGLCKPCLLVNVIRLFPISFPCFLLSPLLSATFLPLFFPLLSCGLIFLSFLWHPPFRNCWKVGTSVRPHIASISTREPSSQTSVNKKRGLQTYKTIVSIIMWICQVRKINTGSVLKEKITPIMLLLSLYHSHPRKCNALSQNTVDRQLFAGTLVPWIIRKFVCPLPRTQGWYWTRCTWNYLPLLVTILSAPAAYLRAFSVAFSSSQRALSFAVASSFHTEKLSHVLPLQALTIARAANSRTFAPAARSSRRISKAMPSLAWSIAIFGLFEQHALLMAASACSTPVHLFVMSTPVWGLGFRVEGLGLGCRV